MIKYKYYTIKSRTLPTDSYMCDLGKDYWELSTSTFNSDTKEYVYVFRKEIE